MISRKISSRHPVRKYTIEDTLFPKNYSGQHKWISVTAVKITGPLSYHVQTSSGAILKRHVDQLCYRHVKEQHLNDTVGDDSLDQDLFDNWTVRTPPRVIITEDTRSRNHPCQNQEPQCSTCISRLVSTYALH